MCKIKSFEIIFFVNINNKFFYYIKLMIHLATVSAVELGLRRGWELESAELVSAQLSPCHVNTNPSPTN